MTTDHEVASVDDLEESDRMLVLVEGREIGIFNVDGELHAFSNWCAHQAGPVCEGNVTGTTEASFDEDSLEVELEYCKDGEVLNCPWHGWEYDITSGECLSRQGVELPEYPVTVKDDTIVVTI